ncbi:hypothetical protein H5410_017705 [Solanum commersonii]|uniref:Transcription factor CBF/NF-Y/archaeal histone domain-containing protein n=1 Tax=Solanum commersonii TaxID=4109 RepID=A0A9J6A022_SOLCO|nr:hypothetical protein H5410_017705 [Solanum commersonii]
MQLNSQEYLKMFWTDQGRVMENVNDFKNNLLLQPTRIKKIMKTDKDVQMISAESPVLLAKACELFIQELTLRSWLNAQENHRRILKKDDVTDVIMETDNLDFLLDDGYKSDGIIVGQSISFLNLKAAISAELDIDVSRKNIEIRYIVEGNLSPMKIKNDMGVKLYLEVKKSEPRSAMYPLCIDTSEKIDGDIHNFDGTCGEITCVVGTTQDTKALAVVESRICDSKKITMEKTLRNRLEMFWKSQWSEMENVNDFKNRLLLPPTRIKKIMKKDEDVRMVAAESPENHRRILKKDDLTDVIVQTDYFDFLLDVVHATDPFTPSSVPFYAAGGSNGQDGNNLDH